MSFTCFGALFCDGPYKKLLFSNNVNDILVSWIVTNDGYLSLVTRRNSDSYKTVPKPSVMHLISLLGMVLRKSQASSVFGDSVQQESDFGPVSRRPQKLP